MGLLTAPLILVRAPLRITLSAAEFGLSTAAEAARIGMELLNPDGEGTRGTSRRTATATIRTTGRGNGGAPDVWSTRPPRSRVPDAPPAVADAPPPVPDELIPDHVDEEAVLVAEVAEEGAEDGAGAELTSRRPGRATTG